MTAVWGAMLGVLKAAGIVLALLSVLVLAVLLLPAGIGVRVDSSGAELRLHCGPVSFRLYPRRRKKPRADVPPEKAPEPPAAPPERAAARVEPPADRTERRAAPSRSPEPPPAAQQAPPPPAEQAPPPGPAPDEPEERGVIERIRDAFLADPAGYALHFFEVFRACAGPLMRSFRVRGLTAVWTVTGWDAACTAILYGQAITALNTALAIARDHIPIQADELRVEPDFLGRRRGERRLCFRVLTRPIFALIVGLRLLVRVRRDPVLLPPNREQA